MRIRRFHVGEWWTNAAGLLRSGEWISKMEVEGGMVMQLAELVQRGVARDATASKRRDGNRVCMRGLERGWRGRWREMGWLHGDGMGWAARRQTLGHSL